MEKRWRGMRLSQLLFLSLFLSVLFSACSIQNQRAELLPNVDLDVSYREAFLSKDFIAKEWKDEKWWTLFNDSQLNTYIEMALEKSPTLDAVEEKIKLAHQSSKRQFAPLLPELDASVSDALAAFSYRRRGTEINSALLPQGLLPHWLNLFDMLLNFKWNLDLWGKQRRLYQAAVDELKMQIAEAAHQKLIISIQVARVYFNLQYFLRRQKLKEERLALLEEKLELTLAQKECGLATEMDIDALEKKKIKLVMSLIDNQRDLACEKTQMGVYLTLNPDQLPNMEMPIAEFNQPFPLPSQVSIDLLAKRADLVAKIWAVQAAVKRVNAAKVAFFPTIDLSSFSGYFNLTYKEIMKPRAWFTSVLPAASLPLFHGLKLRSNLKSMLYHYNYAVFEYNELLVQAAKEVVDSLTSFRLCQDQIFEQQQVLNCVQKDLNLLKARFEWGLNTLPQVMDQRDELLYEKEMYVQLLQLRLLSVLNLIKAIGGGYDNPQAQVDLQQDFIYE